MNNIEFDRRDNIVYVLGTFRDEGRRVVATILRPDRDDPLLKVMTPLRASYVRQVLDKWENRQENA